MKTTRKLIALIAVVLVITSCKNNTQKKEISTKEETTVITKTENHNDNEDELTLNNGKRWEANPETTEGIKKLQLLLKGFSDKESVTAYTALTANLEKQFADIFAKCTMKGEAHNQLHNFLKPMLDLFDGMKSSDLDVCKKSYAALSKHLSLYNLYFK